MDGLSYAPLAAVAAAYRKVGADVLNIPKSEEHEAIFNEMAARPLADLLDAWLDHVRAHGQ